MPVPDPVLPLPSSDSPRPVKPVSPYPLYLASLLLDLAFSQSAMAFPWIAQSHFGASAETIGEIAGISTAIYTAVAFSAGWLARWLPASVRLGVAAAGASAAYAGAAAAPSLTLLAVCLWVSSFFLATFWPALQTRLSAGCTGPEIQRRVTRFNVSWSFGIMLGPALAGVLYQHGARLPYVAGCAVALLVAAVVTLGPPLLPVPDLSKTGETADPGRYPSPIEDRPGEGTPWLLYAAWCGHFGSYFCSACLASFFPLLANEHHVSVVTQGYLRFELGAFQTAAFFGMTVARRWLDRPVTYFAGTGLVITGLLVVSLATVPSFVLGLAITGAGFGITYVLSLFHSLHSLHPDRNSGIHEGIVGGSGIFGSLEGGFAANQFGLRTPFYLGSATVAAALIPTCLFLVRHKKQRQ